MKREGETYTKQELRALPYSVLTGTQQKAHRGREWWEVVYWCSSGEAEGWWRRSRRQRMKKKDEEEEAEAEEKRWRRRKKTEERRRGWRRGLRTTCASCCPDRLGRIRRRWLQQKQGRLRRRQGPSLGYGEHNARPGSLQEAAHPAALACPSRCSCPSAVVSGVPSWRRWMSLSLSLSLSLAQSTSKWRIKKMSNQTFCNIKDTSSTFDKKICLHNFVGIPGYIVLPSYSKNTYAFSFPLTIATIVFVVHWKELIPSCQLDEIEMWIECFFLPIVNVLCVHKISTCKD